MKYFGTDGIRGQVNSGNINGDMFFKFGLAAGKYFTNLKKRRQSVMTVNNKRKDKEDKYYYSFLDSQYGAHYLAAAK